MLRQEKDYILKFTDIWYSEATWEQLQRVKIHS